jgi:nicotinamide-nucleotide amidase
VTELVVPGDTEFNKLVETLSARLVAKGWRLACAESCTGGWIAKCCTDQAGSSAWFERGLVAYSYKAKQELLGVNAEDLLSSGAVSREIALQMAEGARLRARVDVALSVTGISGPGGGMPDKPVGTVWFGWSVSGECDAEQVHFEGNRDAVRRCTVAHALQGLIDRLID